MAVNVANDGYIPDVAAGAIVEVGATVDADGIHPDREPPVGDPVAGWIAAQLPLQQLLVDAAVQRDPELAFQALVADPLSPPDERACRAMFDECALQRDAVLIRRDLGRPGPRCLFSVQAFRRSGVQPFSRSAVQPFSHQPFSRSAVQPIRREACANRMVPGSSPYSGDASSGVRDSWFPAGAAPGGATTNGIEVRGGSSAGGTAGGCRCRGHRATPSDQ
jgi:hypothetical protein